MRTAWPETASQYTGRNRRRCRGRRVRRIRVRWTPVMSSSVQDIFGPDDVSLDLRAGFHLRLGLGDSRCCPRPIHLTLQTDPHYNVTSLFVRDKWVDPPHSSGSTTSEVATPTVRHEQHTDSTPDLLNEVEPTFALCGTTSPVPVELCEAIIDYVAMDEGPHRKCYLYSCALTCRAWVPRCRYHLTVQGFVLKGPKTVATYASTLRLFPNLATWVESLEINIDAPASWIGSLPSALGPFLPGLTRIRIGGNLKENLTLHPTFNRCLTLFQSVTELEWSLPVETVFTTLTTFISQLPALRKLRIRGRGDPTLTMVPAPDLHLHDFSLQRPIPPMPQLTHLSFLDIAADSLGLAAWLSSIPSIRELQVLVLDGLQVGGRASSEPFRDLVSACVGVQVLTLKFSFMSERFTTDEFSLHTCTNLRVLAISISRTTSSLTRLLRTVPSMHLIRLTLCLDDRDARSLGRVVFEDLHCVDEALCSSQFERLVYSFSNYSLAESFPALSLKSLGRKHTVVPHVAEEEEIHARRGSLRCWKCNSVSVVFSCG
ncbi:hypothetical protein BXZ70DRAFT_230000 [Cristinia sonorae]|uniref:F-box domain-containing protein n=1 Tax=Cristinia sonorae TaxID=1940300 RepID=A0A8K0UMM1_9AGAR|nr:hypothetical protein BXZ70DRAFT_230000 [Cristinia sonorae]